MKNISITQIASLLVNGDALGQQQGKVLFELLNTTNQAPEAPKAELTYLEKVAAHKASKKGKAKPKATPKAKPKVKGTPSQARNVHSKAKTAGIKNGQTVPAIIIGWFGAKKTEKTIAQICEGTGLSNKEVGDSCWNQVKKGTMISTVVGKYGMA